VPETGGKTLLHLACDFKAYRSISYLMFKEKANPNLLSAQDKLAPLHIATY